MRKNIQHKTEFYLESEYVNLNVSTLAQSVLNADDMIFSEAAKKKNFLKVSGGFVNRVLKNMLACIMADDDAHRIFQINEALVNLRDYQAHFNIRLNKDVLDDFNDLFERVDVESDYVKRPTQYLKAMLETYARLPFLVRENIVLKDTLDLIYSAIHRRKNLYFHYADKKFTVNPFDVVPSKEGTFCYLAAEMDGDLKIFRLSRIEDLRLGGASKQISDDKKREYRERITKYGPTFADKPITTVKVRLTEKGVESYRYSVLHRPIHEAIEDGNVYVFNCPEQQAEYFFFRFAEKVEILEPKSLRDKFAKQYADGLHNHTEGLE